MSGLSGMSTASVSVLPGGTGGRVLDFRRRGTPPRRRRKSRVLRLLKPLAVAALVVATPAALVGWVLTAPLFQLKTVDVRQVKGAPSGRVPAAWVRQALAPLTGRNLVQASLAEATARVQANPWIASVEMVKELPDRLRVRIAERRPVALMLAGAGLVYADSDGRAIAPVATPAELAAARKVGLLVVSFPPASRIPPASAPPSTWRPSSAASSRTGRRSSPRSRCSTRRTSACALTPCRSRSWCAAARWPPRSRS